MPDIQIPAIVITILQVLLAFSGAFIMALWISMIVWTFRDARSRSRDAFAIMLATLMTVIFGPLGVLLYFLLRPQITLAELYERSLEEEALLQDLDERNRCPGCSRMVENDWIVCPDCHTQLKQVCVNCGEGLHLRWSICPYCATPVAETESTLSHVHDHDHTESKIASLPKIEAVPEPEIEAVTETIEVEAVTPIAPPDPKPSIADQLLDEFDASEADLAE